jgi:uncharacterized RmlC-like cupin family protein
MATHRPPPTWKPEAGQTPSMTKVAAVSRSTVGSERLYTSVVTTAGGGTTRVHHHGECETSIYVIAGRARFTWGPTGVEAVFEAEAGDVVYIPAGEAHVEENASPTAELVVLVTRNCPEGETHFLDSSP